MQPTLGANHQSGKTTFTVWSPLAKSLEVIISGKDTQPLTVGDFGYWTSSEMDTVQPGDRYQYRIDGGSPRPDPAALSQPDGVHGASAVVDLPAFNWSDTHWQGIALRDMIIYELHVGTFTPEGTFEAIIGKLDYLKDLGVNTIELMPIAQFPGNRNWGYDGVHPYAVQHSYGGAVGLQKLVNACHQQGIAVLLDVVYNHLGPEGNYLSEFGPYFTDKHHTPWGLAINFDDAYCDGVRHYFQQNALMWLRDFHIDGLRLDAIHAIKDSGAKHFLAELSQAKELLSEQTGRNYVLIGECDLNDHKYISPQQVGGYGLDGQWIDEFHHALHTMLTGEDDGYYADFSDFSHLAKAYEKTYVYDGIYSPYRKRTFGNSAEGRPHSQFVVFAQNHDQVGNRMLGDRLTETLPFPALKLAAGAVLVSPYVPMLFMGEEYGETRPFQYFVSHTDPELVEAVRQGRKREFAYFQKEDQEVPDPQSEETFNHSKLSWDWSVLESQLLFKYYQALIKLRKELPAWQDDSRPALEVTVPEPKIILLTRQHTADESVAPTLIVLNFSKRSTLFTLPMSRDETYEKIFDSEDTAWGGEAPQANLIMAHDTSSQLLPYNLAIYQRSTE
ncbi:malto-oligosyltrehalose trehalohydrolase [Tunicatimonas pelagia]|uniref:malto-oligosyltrehalose trehalohydrolase n=1 Tax=Tunicatimonas pelagia TaxID=931531 RepID=UPI002665332A|nr:malto-oligosyltrehalose trehalohydrolase [Tunicatimonas pelagia]WKN43455.1 malto-oligosyltrehalose trehalohydrolase [Tunicatimonas pelagia]